MGGEQLNSRCPDICIFSSGLSPAPDLTLPSTRTQEARLKPVVLVSVRASCFEQKCQSNPYPPLPALISPSPISTVPALTKARILLVSNAMQPAVSPPFHQSSRHSPAHGLLQPAMSIHLCFEPALAASPLLQAPSAFRCASLHQPLRFPQVLAWRPPQLPHALPVTISEVTSSSPENWHSESAYL